MKITKVLVSRLIVKKKVPQGNNSWKPLGVGREIKVKTSPKYFYNLHASDYFDGTPNGMDGVIYPKECLTTVHEIRTTKVTTKRVKVKF